MAIWHESSEVKDLYKLTRSRLQVGSIGWMMRTASPSQQCAKSYTSPSKPHFFARTFTTCHVFGTRAWVAAAQVVMITHACCSMGSMGCSMGSKYTSTNLFACELVALHLLKPQRA